MVIQIEVTVTPRALRSLTVNLFHRHSSFYNKVICFTGQRWHLALSSFSLELAVNASFTDPAMTLRLIKYLSILFLWVVVVLFLRLVPPSSSTILIAASSSIFCCLQLGSSWQTSGPHPHCQLAAGSHLALTSVFVLGR